MPAGTRIVVVVVEEEVRESTGQVPSGTIYREAAPQARPAEAEAAPEKIEPGSAFHVADFHSYMTAGAAGVVTIYPNKQEKPMPGENYMRGTMIHETDHTWSYKTWGTDKTKGKWVEWKAAMDKDKVAVSGYAKASIAEDVAETIQVYVSTQGSPRFSEYRAIVPNRFGMLDTEYK